MRNIEFIKSIYLNTVWKKVIHLTVPQYTSAVLPKDNPFRINLHYQNCLNDSKPVPSSFSDFWFYFWDIIRAKGINTFCWWFIHPFVPGNQNSAIWISVPHSPLPQMFVCSAKTPQTSPLYRDLLFPTWTTIDRIPRWRWVDAVLRTRTDFQLIPFNCNDAIMGFWI